MTAGKLTTHVLDTANGCPASGIPIELWNLSHSSPQKLKRLVTNSDGRTDAPLLQGSNFAPGTYELRFAVGAYFQGQTTPLSDPPF